MAAPRGLARLAEAALDALLPPRCLCCGEIVDRQGGLCPTCWAGLTFIAPPLCACCGLPFAFAVPGEALCGACVAAPPAFARARSVLVYDDASRPLVLGFKHGDRTHAARAFGAWLARAGAELLAEADLLVPVPLHRWRLFARRYNQAALLAQAVARVSGVPAAPDLLVRRRRTRSQGGLDREGRARNVAGAFALRPGRADRVAGRSVVLVDDVLTTGATVGECAKALTRAGAARIAVLTLARVVRG
ncbi:ComF family protein [Azospirillum sp. ST 5-10]|uniref:ComF family protein n=1 Tax=unclassified Azospirillum TaxID=2630922 RepID=UPI003F49D551